MMKDLKNQLGVHRSIAPGVHMATVNGVGVDLKAFHGAVAIFDVGTITDGTHTPKLQESDDNSTFADVVAADQEGTLVALASDVIQRAGYKGSKRYIRAVSTVAAATTGGVYGAAIVCGHPTRNPVA